MLTVLTPAQFLAAVSEVTPALDKNPDEGVPKCQNAIMPIFEITEDALVPIKETTFSAEGIKERGDLQQLLKTNIGAIAPECYVLAEEYGNWSDSKRRIDLLCLDEDANLVVVELKRTEDGGHSELQAIRYAAMVHLMTFDDAVTAHAAYLQKNPEYARQAILDFLGWQDPEEEEFARDVRIVLVSAEFSKEITSTAIWLTKKDVDVRCVRMKPYTVGGRRLVDIQQILPLPEAAAYQVQLRKKVEEERQSRVWNLDLTKYDLVIGEQTYNRLTKRKLIFLVMQALIRSGVTPEQIMEFFPKGVWIWVDGDCNHDEFVERMADQKTVFGGTYNLKRYYTNDDELFHTGGKTYAFTNQVGISHLTKLDEIIKKFAKVRITYKEASES